LRNRRGLDREAVLVVDNDDLVGWAAAQGLTESGYSVRVAVNARDALQLCSGAAVALLDHATPDMEGLALAEALRHRHPRCRTVLMTADPTPELRRQARERGICRVIEKPFSLETLIAAIREALEGGPAPVATRPEPRPEAGSGGGDAPGLTEADHGH
jgi:two-component system nitrogen regulation response regulator GlnG